MSDSFAAFRKHKSADLRNLADEHFKHECAFLPSSSSGPRSQLLLSTSPSTTNANGSSSLRDTDRDLLQTAGKKFGTYAAIGSVIGLGLGAFLALRVRQNRMRMFNAFRATEKPTHVQFADGRTEAIPDITPMLAPTALGDFFTYTLFGLGGLFVCGELGGLAGAYSANRTISSDPDARKRIEQAFRGFQADVLKRQAKALESGEDEVLNF